MLKVVEVRCDDGQVDEYYGIKVFKLKCNNKVISVYYFFE